MLGRYSVQCVYLFYWKQLLSAVRDEAESKPKLKDDIKLPLPVSAALFWNYLRCHLKIRTPIPLCNFETSLSVPACFFHWAAAFFTVNLSCFIYWLCLFLLFCWYFSAEVLTGRCWERGTLSHLKALKEMYTKVREVDMNRRVSAGSWQTVTRFTLHIADIKKYR